ncbi:MAG: diguanylate cyclase [Magnetococcales bacterium]|nr:diguanylate cyclase [Magnetococcales bacterium]
METEQVLVIDRSRLYATVLQRDLSVALGGVQVAVLSTVAEAVAWLSRDGRNCCLVVLDPEEEQPVGALLDGCLQRRVAVVLFSALAEELLQPIVAREQAVDYILKENPSSVDQVVTLVVRLVRNRAIRAVVVDADTERQQQLSRWLQQQQLHVSSLPRTHDAAFFINTHADVRLVVCSSDLAEPAVLLGAVRQRQASNEMAVLAVMAPSRVQKTGQTEVIRMIKRGVNDLLHWPIGAQEMLFRVSSALDTIDRMQQLQALVVTDTLTGLFSLKYLEESGRKLLACDKRGQVRLCVAMVEIDGWRHIVAHNNQSTVNLVIKRTANLVRDFFRNTDVVGCYSPSRFCALLVDMDPEYVREFFERLRQSIQDEEFTVRGRSIRVNISIGVQLRPLESINDTFAAASGQLTDAQLRGGNRVQIAS